MNRMIATLTAVNVLLGTAAYAGTSAPAGSSASQLASVGPGARNRLAVTNPNVPGATGRTIVPGDNSTIAGDAAATRAQQTGGMTHD
jgi:uncharacterized iron-regulated membrane protein